MESQSKSGHDILTLRTWWAHEYAKNLAPVDDIVEPLIKQNGAVNDTVKYLGYADGALACSARDALAPISRDRARASI
jgi:hypothetical protein